MSKVELFQGTPATGGKDKLTVASTLITAGRLLMLNSNGYLAHMTTGNTAYGLAEETKAASDTTIAPVQYSAGTKGVVYKFYVDSGTPSQAVIGDKVELHANGGLDLGASSTPDVLIVGLTDDANYVLGILINPAF